MANCLDINRGDRFDHMVSMSGPSRGLQDWAAEHVPADSPKRKERYVLGDVNVSLIKTARGKTIVVEHGTNLPRPYSRIHMVQGTKGLFQGYPNRVYIEGRGKEDQWQEAQAVLAEFEHPLWKEIAEMAKGAGHGGMDFIEDYRLIKCLREGTPTDFNVYDAAAISAVVGLSVQSVGRKAAPVDFPDSLSDRHFESTTARLERGKYLVDSVMGCLGCHTETDFRKPGSPPVEGRLGAGARWADAAFPWVVAPNITPDKETGAGNWTDDMLARAIREGIGHDGRALFPIMPYQSFRLMSDEDLAAVVVYIRSLPAVRNQLPSTQIPFPLNFLIKRFPQPITARCRRRTSPRRWLVVPILVRMGFALTATRR